MKKMVFLVGLCFVFFFSACGHSPPGWTPLPDDEEEIDAGQSEVRSPDAGVDAPADAPDSEYIPDSGNDASINLADAAVNDSGKPDACVCPCDKNDDDGEDSCDGKHCGGNGHWKEHCHHGYYCKDPAGHNCHHGYHCHLGHDCHHNNGHGHPECLDGAVNIYEPVDTCGNPCQCPGDNNDGDDDEEDKDMDD